MIERSATVVEPRAALRQIRGSSLLVAGRALSMVVTLLVQVLIVRHLSKGDFGAFAYALAVVGMAASIVTLGLDRAITRFVPIYHEREDYPKLFGTILMVIAVVLGLGLLLVALFLGSRGTIARGSIADPGAAELLLVLILLVPIQAFDDLLIGLFAVFAKPRAIFMRKHVIAPALRLGVVVALIAYGSGAVFLAAGYVVASFAGVCVYSLILAREMARAGLFRRFELRAVRFPAREVLAFSLPLISSDLVYVLISSMDTLLLGHYHAATAVAAYKVVYPAARLNQTVLASFGLLFTPAAARLFARQEQDGINDLYWRNATWIAVMSFPIFVATFVLARPVTVWLYGERYATSAPFLAILSLGFYCGAALGQNGLTLKVCGKVRYVVVVNALTAVFSLVVGLVLIPPFGALGAAITTGATLIAFNLLKQAGLGLGTGIRPFDPRYTGVYAGIALATAVLLALDLATGAPAYVGLAFGAFASLALLRLNRRVLDVERTFPELLRLPLARPLLGGPPRPG